MYDILQHYPWHISQTNVSKHINTIQGFYGSDLKFIDCPGMELSWSSFRTVKPFEGFFSLDNRS